MGRGTGSQGYNGEGMAATLAQLNSPSGVAVDGSNTLYIADSGNYRIRKVNTSGVITTVAGITSPGFSGDGGVATTAQLNNPPSVAVDGAGNLYLADQNNQRIRVVNGVSLYTLKVGSWSDVSVWSQVRAAKTHLPPRTVGSCVECGVGCEWPGLPCSTGVGVYGFGNLDLVASSQIRKVSTSGILTTVVSNGRFG